MKGNYFNLQKGGQSIRLLTGLLFVMLSLAFQQQAFSQTCPNFSYNLDQGKNGDEDSPENPVNWVNGNLNASQSHFVEGYSIPYRAVLTGLTPGQCFCIRIEWDIRHSGVNALDYITSYPNCTNSLMDDPSHQGSFMHGPECVNPVLGTTMDPAAFTTYPIPSPTNNISALGNMMPVYSFNNQAEANRMLTMFGGTITSADYFLQGSLTVNQTSTSMDICFTADNDSAILAWGGHIASRLEWGVGNSAGSISGSPYHMRVLGMKCCSQTVYTGGNQDRSLQAAAVIPAPIAIITGLDTVCVGNNNTVMITTNQPGTTSYEWAIASAGTTGAAIVGSDTSQQVVISATAAGEYIICGTITINGVSATACDTVTVLQAPVCSITGDGLVCGGQSTTFTASAANSYLWNTGETTQSIEVSASGTYTVTVSNSFGCSSTCTKDLAYSDAIDIDFATSSVNCFGGSDGSIDVTATGGSGNLTYEWNTGVTTEDISGMAAGTYTVTVTDENGCSATESTNVSQPTFELSLSATHTDVLCNNGSDGSIDLTVNGGTPAYSYDWSNGSTDEDPTGLSAGTYNVIVTDANGCTAATSVEIEEPSLLVIDETHINVACNGGNDGSIDITVSGGTLNYSYAWSNGSTAEDITGLSAGDYTVTVTDGNGCTATETISISQAGTLVVNETHVDVLCYNGTNGSIDLTVSGGTPGYSYDWNDGASTEDRSGLSAGTYTVTVTDNNGCSAIENITISQPDELTLSEQHGNVSCYGGSNGFIAITTNGGTEPYDFSWNNGAVTEDLTGLSSGTYTIVVTDENGCTATETVQITQPDELVITDGDITNVSCFEGENGAIDITVAGGTQPYDYSWSNGEITEDLTDLAAGTYTVVVTDENGCSTTDSYTVTEPTLLTVSETNIDVTCNGLDNGSIDITVNGGTPSYSYLWSNGSGLEDISNLSPGIYTVTVTDDNGCTASTSAEISQPDSLQLMEQHTNETCNESNDGSINLGVMGGTPDYNYNWSNGATSQDISNLAAGTYTVTVTDANNCSATTSVQITQPDPLEITGSATDALCNGAGDGTIGITVTGGTPDYSYAWSNNATTEDLSGLAAGTYTVVVTDENGCSATESFTVEQPSTLAVSGQATDALCNGSSDGSIGITVTGGTEPFNFVWSNGASSEDISGLAAGTYTVTVTDGNNCSVTESYTVGEPDALDITGQAVNALCNGNSDGSVGITVTGGTQPYTYAWSNNATTEDLTGLAAGVYTVVVTDDNGCSATESFTVGQPDLLTISGQASNALCYGSADGSVGISVNGGTPDYSYAWSNNATTEDLSGLSAGTYTVVVTDENGCSATESYTVNQPDSIEITGSATDALCNGAGDGTIGITVTGGTPDYSYAWSNNSTTEDLSGLAAGTYTVVVTDENVCSATASYTVDQPSTLTISGQATDALCNGGNGSVDISISGGTQPYSILWNNGVVIEDLTAVPAGSYTVVVTDANNCSATQTYNVGQPSAIIVDASGECSPCNIVGEAIASVTANSGTGTLTYLWSNGATTTSISNLFSGTYTVTVTDENGCSATGVVVLDCDPKCQYTTFTMGGWGADPNGNNPGVYLHANFSSAFPNGLNIGCNNNLKLTSAQAVTNFLPSGSTASMLPSGNMTNPGQGYSNVLAGQLVAATLSVTFDYYDAQFAGEPMNLGDLEIGSGTFAGWTVNQLLDSANAFIGGCGSMYSASDFNSALTSVNEDFDNGNVHTGYLLCPSEELTATVTSTDVTCSNVCDGTASVSVMFGTAPYNYMWSNGATSASVTGLCEGTYTVTVEDDKKCAVTLNVTIGKKGVDISLTFVVTDVTCNGAGDGAIDLTVNGGTAPYGFQWSNGDITEDITNLDAATYTVIVTDKNGCTATGFETVAEPDLLVVTIDSKGNKCSKGKDGEAEASATGGTGAYTYLWSNGETTQMISGLTAGIYTVTVTDANGCTASDSVEIMDLNSWIDISFEVTHAVCAGSSNGEIDATVTGGTPGYTYLWSNGATVEDITGLPGGNYTLTVTDANGCSNSVATYVIDPAPIVLGTKVDAAVCGLNGVIDLTVSGGWAPYTYLWSNGKTTEDLTKLEPKAYTVTVTDVRGCTAQTTATVGGTKQMKIQIKSVTHASDTACDGDIDIKVINGTAPYTYKWQKINTTPFVTMGTSQDLLNVCPAMYRVRVTDAEGCIKYRKVEVKYLKDVLAPVKIDYSSLQTPGTGISVQNIFPSPASDIANVVITSEKSATASVQVIDIMGQLVIDLEDVQLESGMARQIELNVSGLEAGTYMVIVNRDGNIATGKLNIAR